MRKRWMTILGSVLVVVCLFLYSPGISAAQVFPQKTASGASGDIKYYCTFEFRGFHTDHVSYTGTGTTPISDTYLLIHVDLTFRNDSKLMAVGNDNNFRLTVNNLALTGMNNEALLYSMMFPTNIEGTEIYELSFNDASSNTTHSFSMDMHPTYTFILEPQEKKDFSFDLIIPCSADLVYDQTLGYSYANWSNVTVSWSAFPSFTMYTMTQYAAEFEGFWPYLLRLLENFTIFNFEDPDVVDKYEEVAEDAQGNTTTSEAIHQQEQNYYDDVNYALEDLEMADFSFDQSVRGGLTWLNLRFIDTWNILGPFNIIPVISLMLLLATQILRHRTGGHRDG